MVKRFVVTGLVLGLAAALTGISPSPAGAVAGYGDVESGRYYTEPVQWAVDNGIAEPGPCFEPAAAVTRGEAALWLWRMQGSPQAPAHSFVDVTDQTQNDAVSWLSSSGVTTGTSPTMFSPDDTLTRAQIAAFLWRLDGRPAPSRSHSFVDVVAGWQQHPVSWMSAQGITTGTSPTMFSPDDTLNRAQIATFLWRYQNKPAVTVDPASPQCQPDTASTFTTIAAGDSHTCAIRSDNTITCWGNNDHGQSDAPAGEFKTVTAGGWHSCAIRSDNTIACWGINDSGRSDAPAGEFKTVTAGGP